MRCRSPAVRGELGHPPAKRHCRRVPIVYFDAIEPGSYVAAYPVFVVEDHPTELRFSMQVDDLYASERELAGSLQAFVRDASPQQIRAWNDSIPELQRETGELVARGSEAGGFSEILEYQLPVLVLELEGKSVAVRTVST